MNIDFYGLEEDNEDKKSQIEENASDKDTDSAAMEAFDAVASLEYFDCFSRIQEQNADMKIRMLRKINAHVSMCRGAEQFASLESFIEEQSLETAAQSEANGGKHEAKGDNVDKDKLGEKKMNFFQKVWEMIKRAFEKVVDWIKRKISAFVKWIRSIFKKNQLDQIKNLDTQEYDSLAAAISKFEFEDQSQDGAIPIYGKAADKLLGHTNSLFSLCKHLDSMITRMTSTGTKPEGFISNLTPIMEALKQVPGIGNIPSIPSASKENIVTFNRELKTVASNLKFSHDPVGFTKYYTGQQLIEGSKSLTCRSYFNTFDPAAIVSICNNTVDCLTKVDDMLERCQSLVNKFDVEFKKFLNKNNYSDKNGNVTISDKIPDDKKDSADLNYQFVGICLSLFKIIQGITSILCVISAKLTDSAKKGSQALLKNKSKAIDKVEDNHMITGANRTAHDKKAYNDIHDRLDSSLTNGSKRYDDSETKTIKDKASGIVNKAKKAFSRI